MSKSSDVWMRRVPAVVLSVLTACASMPLHADENNVDDLFGVVSSLTARTPTMFPLALSKTPGTVSIITQEQIKALGVSSLDELLAYLPGVDAFYSPMGFAGNIRGFGGSPFQEGVQYLVDGFLYNSPDKGGSSTTPGYVSFPVPVEMIQQVEVMREPISALYGPNAFFGVVNVITKSGADLNNGGSIGVRAGNRNSGRGLMRYSALYGRQDGPWNWALSGDFGRELGPMAFNDKSRITTSQTAAKVQNGKFLFTWLNQTGKTDPFNFIVDTLKSQQNINEVGTHYEKDIVPGVALGTKTSYLSRRGTNCQVCHNPLFMNTTAPSDHREAFYRFTQQVHARVTLLPRHEMTVGGEFLYDKEHMDSGVMGEPRLVSRTYGEFLQDIYQVTDNFSATLGVRADTSDWSNKQTLLNPRALFVYNYSDATTWRAGYTVAHRVPTYHDGHVFFQFLPVPTIGTLFLMGDPNVKSERIQTYNFGTDHWFNKQLLVSANGFLSLVHNQIDRRILLPPQMAQLFPSGLLPNGLPMPPASFGEQFTNNPADARIAGGELETKFKASRFLDLGLNYGYKDVHFQTDPKPAMGGSNPPNAPHHIASLIATVYPVKGLSCTVAERYRSEFFGAFIDQWATGLGLGDRSVKQSFLTNANVRYAFVNGFELAFLANNIFNQRPRQWDVPIDTSLDTGRDFFVEAKYAFGGEKTRR